MPMKLQFSLRWMFAAVAVVALIAAEAVAFPGWVALIFGLIITSLLVPALVVGIVYSRRSARAFCIGALVWLLGARWLLNMSFGVVELAQGARLSPTFFLQVILSPSPPGFSNEGTTRYDCCILWSLTIISGFIAMFIRWLTLGKSSGEGE